MNSVARRGCRRRSTSSVPSFSRPHDPTFPSEATPRATRPGPRYAQAYAARLFSKTQSPTTPPDCVVMAADSNGADANKAPTYRECLPLFMIDAQTSQSSCNLLAPPQEVIPTG
jgi:hypothetical protein